ncbi:MAG: flavocytochrome c [Spirochaetales bacterium]|nr:flavocytochrome c [Spirochaetales bacterium]
MTNQISGGTVPLVRADVIVIGSGFAGLSAAIEAHNAGSSVVIIEKMHAPGGNSLISDGGIAAAGTEEQKKAGIADTPGLFYKDMMKAGLGINHPELVKTVTDNSKEAYEWLRDYIGVPFLEKIEIFGGHSVPRCFTPEGISGSVIVKKLIQKIKEKNIKIMFHTHFTGFIRNTKGKVTGIEVTENYNYKKGDTGTVKHIMAGKAVILAAGGFGSDIDFRSSQDPRLTGKIDTTNQPSATSESLKAALHIGSCPVHLSHIQLGPWASPDEKGYGDGPSFSEYIVFQRGIVIDPGTGKRFANELADRKTLSDAILETGHPCIGIADSAAVKNSGWNIEKCLKKGIVKQFASPAELASDYGINPVSLEKTIDRFNSFVLEKNDTDFKKPVIDTASEIKTLPFYGIRLWPKVHFTMGGILINKNAQVLDLDGRPVEGLYAAGEVTGGVHGASRLGSCAITECIVLGRIAGMESAK